MNISVIGSDANLDECRRKFGETHVYQGRLSKDFSADVTFDFEPETAKPEYYIQSAGVIFSEASFVTFAQRTKNTASNPLFGFAGLPGFLNRPVLEATILNPEDLSVLNKICSALQTPFQVVKDQVGLITPRVICMIINEAYFAIQDRTASRSDIDLAMKTGTNYPFGPFEWGARIGLLRICKLLSTLEQSTGDKRYRICTLLLEESKSSIQ